MNLDNKQDSSVAVTAYGEVCRAYERIDDFRSKLLGFLPLVTGGVIAALLSGVGKTPSNWVISSLLTPAGVLGGLSTIGLALLELRGVQRCIRLATVGMRMERSLGVEGRFLTWPTSVGHFINEPIAAAFIYSAVLSSWVFLALMPVHSLTAWLISMGVFGLSFASVWRFYRYVSAGEYAARARDANGDAA